MTKPVSFRLDEDLKTELEQRAKNLDVNLTTYLKMIIEKELKSENWKKIESNRKKTDLQLDELTEKSDHLTKKIIAQWERMDYETQNTKLRNTISNIEIGMFVIGLLEIIMLVPIGYVFLHLIMIL